MTEPPRRIADLVILGRMRTMEDLHQIMRSRAQQLDITLESIGRAALLPARYANKVLAPTPMKGLGLLSMPSLMEVLQFELVAVERHDVPQRITDKLEKRRSAASSRAVRQVRMISKRFLRMNAKKGGTARAAKLGVRKRRQIAKKANRARQRSLTPKQRKQIAIRAAQARWGLPIAARAVALTAPTDQLAVHPLPPIEAHGVSADHECA